jgi:hypothetical protein
MICRRCDSGRMSESGLGRQRRARLIRSRDDDFLTWSARQHPAKAGGLATDGALLSDMLARQSSVIAAFKDGLNILFVHAGQNDLVSTDAPVWLAAFTAYLEEGGHAHQSKCLRLDSKRWEYKAASPSEQQPGLSSEYKQGRKRPPGVPAAYETAPSTNRIRNANPTTAAPSKPISARCVI